MASDILRKIFKPGETVQKPGIYKVVHKLHRDAHETSLRLKETFPACEKCGDDVRFELVHPAREHNGKGET